MCSKVLRILLYEICFCPAIPKTTGSSSLNTTFLENQDTTTQTGQTTTTAELTTSGEATTLEAATTSGETTTLGETTTSGEATTVGEKNTPGTTTTSGKAAQNTTLQTGECACNCLTVGPGNWTMEQLMQQAEKQAEQIKQELTVDKTHLSSTIRKVTSAPDNRPSAANIGFVGITFLVVSFGMIVLMDFTAFCKVAEKVAKDPSKQS